MSDNMKAALIALAVLASFIPVSCMSYQDAVDEAAHCAEMVEAGAWPEEVCR